MRRNEHPLSTFIREFAPIFRRHGPNSAVIFAVVVVIGIGGYALIKGNPTGVTIGGFALAAYIVYELGRTRDAWLELRREEEKLEEDMELGKMEKVRRRRLIQPTQLPLDLPTPSKKKRGRD